MEAQSTDPAKAYEELGDHILKFESLNATQVPMEVGESSGGESLRPSLFNHSAKFHKMSKLKFGKEKLQKAIKQHEKQENFGTLEKYSKLKGKGKVWSHSVFLISSHSYNHFFIPLILIAWWSLKIVRLVR